MCGNEHRDTLCKKANSSLGLLGQIWLYYGGQEHRLSYSRMPQTGVCLSSVWNLHTQCKIDKIHVEMVQCPAARFVDNNYYSHFSLFSPMIYTLGWDSLENHRLINQVFMFYKIYKGLVGISLPPEISHNIRASRSPNCPPFYQLTILNYTYIKVYPYLKLLILSMKLKPLSLACRILKFCCIFIFYSHSFY